MAYVDGNREKYESDDVVSLYERRSDLQPCEKHLFSRYIRPGMAILDMGVGGGRTTPYLAKAAGRYVGADYSEGMIEACQRRFPDQEFQHCDATDMAAFDDEEFDAVVFSFNGIDVIRTDDGRARCLSETARVLKPGGIFIFSSHNAKLLGVWPLLADARGHQIPWRVVRSVFKSAVLAARNLGSGPFSDGVGYVRDPEHGGMDYYVSTPETMAPQLAGFETLEVVGGHFPHVQARYLTPWYYYACRKQAASSC
jgi:ubiquinone/menaquinone biosynthesis C-methylase UbiE